ncbi:AAA family ATPase, partial [Acinetobacter baumannii]
KQRGTWISPPEFNGISDQQRDELQNFIAERGLDVKTVCEHFGIDALTQIEAAQLEKVKQEIEQLAKQEISA